MEKIQAFLTWWHSIFGSWNPNKLPSLSFWFLEDCQMEQIPILISWLALAVVVCSAIALIHSLIRFRKGYFLTKIITVPVCFLGLIGLAFANEMSYELFHEGFRTFREIYGELIPGLFTQPNFGSFLMELLSVILAIPLNLFQILLYLALTLLGLSPFIGLLVFDVIIYKFMAPIHFLADVGGGILLILGVAMVVLGIGFIGAIFMLTAGAPIFFQAIREWNFTASGGTIIRE